MGRKPGAVAMLLFGMIACCLIAPQIACARAGGGGGASGGGGGAVALVVWPLFIAYSAIVSVMLARKGREAKNLLSALEARDASWDLDNITARVERVYFKVQQAWMDRNQDEARDFMSPRLYEKHKMQTDRMIEQHRKNVLQNVNLIQSKVVGVKDFADDKKDRFWVHIKGSMIDYTIDDRTEEIVSGDPTKTENFTELWMFVRSDRDWVLDEIDQEVSLTDIASLECFTQQAAAGA